MNQGDVHRIVERAKYAGGLVSLAVLIGLIHTGVNVHGGNPTIFGAVSHPRPLLGWLIALSSVVAVPIAYQLAVGLAMLVLGAGASVRQRGTEVAARSGNAEPNVLAGGYVSGELSPGLLYRSEPLPPEFDGADEVAQGICEFGGQASVAGGPSGSPPLQFKMGREAIWTLNLPDGSLYWRVPWADVDRFVVDRSVPGVTRRTFHGTFVNFQFMFLEVEPSAGAAEAIEDVISERGIRLEIVETRAEDLRHERSSDDIRWQLKVVAKMRAWADTKLEPGDTFELAPGGKRVAADMLHTPDPPDDVLWLALDREGIDWRWWQEKMKQIRPWHSSVTRARHLPRRRGSGSEQ